MDLDTARKAIEDKFPDKKIIGNPGEYEGEYIFKIVDKDFDEGDIDWDSTFASINIESGDISAFSILDRLDIMQNVKPL